MELTYRCMKCGNNIVPGPHPTYPPNRKKIDFNDPSSTCQCAPGLCPCGKFVAHLASEAWDPENPHLFGGEAMEWHKKKAEETK